MVRSLLSSQSTDNIPLPMPPSVGVDLCICSIAMECGGLIILIDCLLMKLDMFPVLLMNKLVTVTAI